MRDIFVSAVPSSEKGVTYYAIVSLLLIPLLYLLVFRVYVPSLGRLLNLHIVSLALASIYALKLLVLPVCGPLSYVVPLVLFPYLPSFTSMRISIVGLNDVSSFILYVVGLAPTLMMVLFSVIVTSYLCGIYEARFDEVMHLLGFKWLHVRVFLYSLVPWLSLPIAGFVFVVSTIAPNAFEATDLSGLASCFLVMYSMGCIAITLSMVSSSARRSYVAIPLAACLPIALWRVTPLSSYIAHMSRLLLIANSMTLLIDSITLALLTTLVSLATCVAMDLLFRVGR